MKYSSLIFTIGLIYLGIASYGVSRGFSEVIKTTPEFNSMVFWFGVKYIVITLEIVGLFIVGMLYKKEQPKAFSLADKITEKKG